MSQVPKFSTIRHKKMPRGTLIILTPDDSEPQSQLRGWPVAPEGEQDPNPPPPAQKNLQANEVADYG